MRLVKYFLFITFFAAIGAALIGMFLPAATHIERRIVIEKSPEVIFAQINNLKNFNSWTSWSHQDPSMKTEYRGPQSGEGATFLWFSDDPNLGTGSRTITASVPNKRVEMALDFSAMGKATSYFEFDAHDDITAVTWGFDVAHGDNLMSRYMGLLMDKGIGGELGKSLQNLKTKVESVNAITTTDVTYSYNGETLAGFVAYPTGADAAPGVLVVHEWWGHNEYARERAKMLAELGYTALALDMYGQGKRAEHPKDANALMMQVLGNADLLEGRFVAALEHLRAMPQTDAERIAAIGYCFGGSVVLNMARTGVALAGVASFHGGLSGLLPLTEVGRDPAYLVLNGAADPMVPEDAKSAFIQSMQSVPAFEFVDYPGAKHAFTNPEASVKGEQFGLPLAYDREADEDSWQRLASFLNSVFD